MSFCYSSKSIFDLSIRYFLPCKRLRAPDLEDNASHRLQVKICISQVLNTAVKPVSSAAATDSHTILQMLGFTFTHTVI